jgi:midasin
VISFLNVKSITEESMRGQFEWVDGTLIKAMEAGHWVVMDNANFCNASVLDRLNPLLEPEGVLLVNECGMVSRLCCARFIIVTEFTLIACSIDWW